MNCPLKIVGAYAASSKINRFDVSCDQADCAWYGSSSGNCAIVELVEHAKSIEYVLSYIQDKMPHEE